MSLSLYFLLDSKLKNCHKYVQSMETFFKGKYEGNVSLASVDYSVN